jgi:hypothetical protein
VLVEWVGYDSDSAAMTYQVRLDDGGWLDNGQVTNRTFTNLAEGTHTVTVRATDNELNQVEDSKEFTTYRFVQLSLSCSPYRASGNDYLKVTGTVSDAATGEGLGGLTIGFAYTIQMGGSWATTSAISGSNGGYEFSIRLEQGAIMGLTLTASFTDLNDEYHYTFANATYAAMTLQGRDGVFLTRSTSTLSDFTYTSKVMRFNVSGDSGTEGTTSILVPKSAINGVSGIAITMDGAPVDFTTESSGDYWVLTFIYTHSKHQVEVNMPSPNVLGAIPSDILPILILVVIGTVAAVIVFVVVRRRRA